MKILFKYTSRLRPVTFERGLRSIIENVSDIEKCCVLVTLDNNDPALNDYHEVLKKYYDKIFIHVCDQNNSSSKIEAINRDINDYKGEWDILVNMSDDMVWTAKSFDETIRGLFKHHFPDGDGFLHLDDGNHGNEIATMSIMDRKYYERDNYIYNPLYFSLQCDREATEVAHMRGRRVYVDVCLFNHLHYEWGLSPNDHLYLLNNRYQDADLMTIRSRRIYRYNIENPVNDYFYPSV